MQLQEIQMSEHVSETLVGGTDEQSLDTWAGGAARVGGLPEEMDSTRAELLGGLCSATQGEEVQGHSADLGGQRQCGQRAREEAGYSVSTFTPCILCITVYPVYLYLGYFLGSGLPRVGNIHGVQKVDTRGK